MVKKMLASFLEGTTCTKPQNINPNQRWDQTHKFDLYTHDKKEWPFLDLGRKKSLNTFNHFKIGDYCYRM